MNEHIINLTIDNFDEEVLKPRMLVLVDFWASWCPPCRILSPIIEEIAEKYVGKVKVGKVNVDEQRALAERYRVMSIPTVFLFKNGQVIDKIVGARPKADIEQFIQKAL